MNDVKRRSHAAYWYAVGYNDCNDRTEDSTYWVDPNLFEEFAAKQAEEYYDYANPRFQLWSVPDQFREFCELIREDRRAKAQAQSLDGPDYEHNRS